MELLSIDKSVGGVSFHTNNSTSLAVTNAIAVVCFFTYMQLFNVTLHQNSKLDSFKTWIDFSNRKPTELQKSLKGSFVKYIQKQNFMRFM